MLKENFRKMCYELYKVDWKRSHMITPEIEMDNIKDYYDNLVDPDTEYTYDDYLNEFGYNGFCFVCFDEFLEAEYLNQEYMRKLLGSPILSCIYAQDLKEIN